VLYPAPYAHVSEPIY
jgi:hypothetical protein